MSSSGKARRKFEVMAHAIGPRKSIVDAVAVDGRLPPWWRRARNGQPLSPAVEAERAALTEALTMLALVVR